MEVKTDIEESARKIHATILQGLANTSQKRTADALGVHESTISRMKSPDGEIEQFARLLAVIGLRVAHADESTYRPDYVEALHTLAKAGLELSPELAIKR